MLSSCSNLNNAFRPIKKIRYFHKQIHTSSINKQKLYVDNRPNGCEANIVNNTYATYASAWSCFEFNIARLAPFPFCGFSTYILQSLCEDIVCTNTAWAHTISTVGTYRKISKSMNNIITALKMSEISTFFLCLFQSYNN